MKHFFISLLFGLVVQLCIGQTPKIANNKERYLIDSAEIARLKADLRTSAKDSSRVMILREIIAHYSNNLDSGLHYCFQALNLSRKINFHEGELITLGLLQNQLKDHGLALKAFNISHKGLKASKRYHNKYYEATFNGELGILYRQSGLYDQALMYLRKGKILYDSIGEPYWAAHQIDNIGEVYLSKGNLDSALLLCRSALKQVTHAPASYFWITFYTSVNLGNIFMEQGNYDSALYYLKLARPLAVFHVHHFNTNLSMARVFEKLNMKDSSLYYANEANLVASESGVFTFHAQVNDFMANFYRKRDVNKSLDFAKASLAYKDSLYRQSVNIALENFDELDEQEKQFEIQSAQAAYQFKSRSIGLLAGITLLLVILGILIRNYRQKQKSIDVLNRQKEELNKAKERTEIALNDLKSTQTQLIHSEKMASLGELTAGIAHEIQNPLNFVNNFSEVNTELVEDLKSELSSGHYKSAEEIANNIKENQEKINHHGKRADAIVKSMLQHSRSNAGQKDLTDINVLCDEYLRLAYHGLRAKDKSFNADIKTDFDDKISKVNVVSQDIGRVLLNLINNAFYAVNQKALQNTKGYQPTVNVTTKRKNNLVEISIKDNGTGIPAAVLEKIFQPFYTTKPSGQGTGLGLSLAYDIVTKGHEGELKVKSVQGEGSEFVIILPGT